MEQIKHKSLYPLFFLFITLTSLLLLNSCGNKPTEPNITDDIILKESEMLDLKQNNNVINRFGAKVFPSVIMLKWEKSDAGTELGYYVYRRVVGEKNWQGPLGGRKLTTTSYDDYDVTSGKKYQYMIKCVNSTETFVLGDSETFYIQPKQYPSSISINVSDADPSDWLNVPAAYITKPFFANSGGEPITWNPVALYNMYLADDGENLYIGFYVFENTWGDDVEYWLAIESTGFSAGEDQNPLPANWGHTGISFKNWAPNFVAVIKNAANNGGINEVWEIHYDYDTGAFTPQTRYDTSLWSGSPDKNWFEMKIPLNTYLTASGGDYLKIALWTSQQGKAGAHWSIPVVQGVNPYGNNATVIDDYIIYRLGSGIQ